MPNEETATLASVLMISSCMSDVLNVCTINTFSNEDEHKHFKLCFFFFFIISSVKILDDERYFIYVSKAFLKTFLPGSIKQADHTVTEGKIDPMLTRPDWDDDDDDDDEDDDDDDDCQFFCIYEM
ncbi:hypothetical protein DNTS_026789 [Danionella cerebrum]|uniref:Uncharacterized protein n=1 Tax=Danionella cerebrum TaxID=2873325 RepID=A0A553NGK3_9TELE|nr:hypothetical protein DNTS_026789 [Danionella translucida]